MLVQMNATLSCDVKWSNNGNKTKYDSDNWIDMMKEFDCMPKSLSSLPEYKDIYDGGGGECWES